ncbi:MAG TPA: hypothetical protein VFM58_08495 [Solirubrobacteraceae bacterium]|jgi:hypothetical protein|nr:hypothetical protein [Solirubrobacteraceae bacterium]
MTDRAHVERLELRVRGGSAESSRALAAALGEALGPVLEAQLRGGGGRIERVATGPVRARPGDPPARTAAAVAERVAGTLGGGERA